jgi:hypothetical protein
MGIIWFLLFNNIFALVATKINPIASLIIAVIIAYRQGVLFDKLAFFGTAMDAIRFDVENESLNKSDAEDMVRKKLHIMFYLLMLSRTMISKK